MKKIVIIARSSGMINELSARAKALFPECEINVVSAKHKNYEEYNSKKRFLGKDIGDEVKPHNGM